ncbi:MAG: phage holin family protein [Sideroxydans sp.]|jgi:hypothetical protein
MPEKDPQTWSLATWALLVVMILLGGITSWYRRVKEGHARAFNLIELVGEFAISGLVGFSGFVVAQNYIGNDGMAAAAAGISAHFATRLLFSAEGLIEIGAKQLAKKVGKL